MVTTTTIKRGYKQTELGIIPDDWQIVKLGKIADITKLAGFEYTNYFNSYRDGGEIIVVRGTNITHNKMDLTDIRTIPRSTSNFLSRSKLSKHDLVFAYVGTIGPVFLIDKDDAYHLGPNTAKITAQNNLYPEFLFTYFNSRFIENEIVEHTSVGAQPSLSMTKIRKFRIILPPTRSEQTAIATALSDTDALIEGLEKLIAKKKAVKQGAMQQLLTGKKRLPGFSGKWEEIILKKMIQIPVTDGPHLTPQFLQNGVPFLSVNNLNNNKIDYSDLRYISRKDHEEFSKKCKPQKNDILLGKAASVGLVALVETDFEFNIWSPIALIRLNNEYIPKFIYYSFQTKATINQIKLLTNSSSQGNIGMGDIEKLNFLVPFREEQAAIAIIFSDMDTEIESLEKKRDKCVMIKQGMMQQLLTGKIRIYANN